MESAPLPPDLAALVPRLPTDAARLMAAAYTSLLEERRVLASAESGGTLTPLLARPPTHLHSDAAVAFLARLERRRLKAAAKEDDAPIGWALHERMAAAATSNPLPRWEAQRERWAALKARMVTASASTRPTAHPRTPLLERFAAHRARREAASAAEEAAPLEERFGAAAWAASLRDNWALAVPLGHPLLSGLAGTAFLGPRPGPGGAPGGGGGERVRHGDDGLCVKGVGLEAALRAAWCAPPGLARVVARMRLGEGGGGDGAGGDVEAAAQVEEAAAAAAAAPPARPAPHGPALAPALSGLSAPRGAAADAAAAAPPAPFRGPRLEVLRPAPGEAARAARRRRRPATTAAAQPDTPPAAAPAAPAPPEPPRVAVVRVANTGTTALYLSARLRDSTRGGDGGGGGGDCAGFGCCGPQFRPAPGGFLAPGARPLLPGDSCALLFEFVPTVGGATAEIWELGTRPGTGEPMEVILRGGGGGGGRRRAEVAAVAEGAGVGAGGDGAGV